MGKHQDVTRKSKLINIIVLQNFKNRKSEYQNRNSAVSMQTIINRMLTIITESDDYCEIILLLIHYRTMPVTGQLFNLFNSICKK